MDHEKRFQDLKQALEAFQHEHALQAGFVLTCVGSLCRAAISRMGSTLDTKTGQLARAGLQAAAGFAQ